MLICMMNIAWWWRYIDDINCPQINWLSWYHNPVISLACRQKIFCLMHLISSVFDLSAYQIIDTPYKLLYGISFKSCWYWNQVFKIISIVIIIKVKTYSNFLWFSELITTCLTLYFIVAWININVYDYMCIIGWNRVIPGAIN